MRAWALGIGLGVVLLAAPLAAEAQAGGKVYRVGLIAITPVAGIMSDPTHPFNSGFRRELRDRGYVEGQNVILELRSLEGRMERASEVSPCGAGTSAKLACLHADGKLQPGETWRQESAIGTVFEASFTVDPEDRRRVLPQISRTAYVTAEATLVFDDDDPLRWGMPRP